MKRFISIFSCKLIRLWWIAALLACLAPQAEASLPRRMTGVYTPLPDLSESIASQSYASEPDLLIEEVYPIGYADDGDYLDMVICVEPQTHTRVVYIVKSPLGLWAWDADILQYGILAPLGFGDRAIVRSARSGFGEGVGRGATVTADYATFGKTRLHAKSVAYQEEARRSGDILSQIGYGSGKVGVEAAYMAAGAGVVSKVAKTGKVASFVVRHADKVSKVSKAGAVLMSANAGVNAGQAINAGIEGDWNTATHKAGRSGISIAFASSLYSSAQQLDAAHKLMQEATPYGSAASPRPTGMQAHHLNQNAAFKSVVPHSQGQTMLVEGSAFVEGTQHNVIHGVTDQFWAPYQPTGPLAGLRPTNLQYLNALRAAMQQAGMSFWEAEAAVVVAAEEMAAAGLSATAPVPRVPSVFTP